MIDELISLVNRHEGMLTNADMAGMLRFLGVDFQFETEWCREIRYANDNICPDDCQSIFWCKKAMLLKLIAVFLPFCALDPRPDGNGEKLYWFIKSLMQQCIEAETDEEIDDDLCPSVTKILDYVKPIMRDNNVT